MGSMSEIKRAFKWLPFEIVLVFRRKKVIFENSMAIWVSFEKRLSRDSFGKIAVGFSRKADKNSYRRFRTATVMELLV